MYVSSLTTYRETGQLPGKAIPLINAGMLDCFNNTPHISTVDLAVGGSWPGRMWRCMTQVTQKETLRLHSRLHAYAIGYIVSTSAAGGDGWIGIFQHHKDDGPLKDEMNNAGGGDAMHPAMTDSGAEPLLLQYGVGFRDPSEEIDVHLYSSGKGIRQVGSLLDQYEGEIAVTGSHFTVKSIPAPATPDQACQNQEQNFEIIDGGVRLTSTKLSKTHIWQEAAALLHGMINNALMKAPQQTAAWL